MIGDTISLTYNAGTVVLTKNDSMHGNGGTGYYGVSGNDRFVLNVKHTIPPRGKPGESHMARLDVEHYDALGVLLRTSSAWSVIRTDNGIQIPADSENAAKALTAFLSAANITKLVNRES
jgi:hypothetical protein